ncbi:MULTISPECIES: glycosyltransferase family 2 protein [Methylobacterium]|uniref:glycosyltransferase family 2 protein n=1 Tax=Methylobacterium TaxID=407 RepID=UPI00197BF922|nr:MULTISPECIES: glycosyltransferase family 2 protein [Methylobacterium]MBN4096159.1 glycosyltransferase family 2 protein [Methylobacterium sp. OT2]UIN36941.1 glycosyltransferase family 2 protein [Methylobacterium oryzae]
MGGKKLAIIVNCYNYEKYIVEAIESVSLQLLDGCELVVVDDGSTDNSWTLIQGTGVKCLRKENGGPVSACVLGLDNTTARHVLFLDADDKLSSGSLRKIVGALDEKYSKLQFPLSIIDEKGDEQGRIFPDLSAQKTKNSYIQDISETGAYVSPPTSGNIFRRDVCDLLREASYDTVDGVILIAAPFMGEIYTFNEALGYYRVHDKNMSSTGRLPSVERLQYSQERFSNRLEHLKHILSARKIDHDIIGSRRNYIYLRDQIYINIVSGEKLTLKQVVELAEYFPKWYGSARRLMTLSAAISMIFLPNRVSKLILRVRLNGRTLLARTAKSILSYARGAIIRPGRKALHE